MEQFFARGFAGSLFVMFGPTHWAVLIGMGLLNAELLLWGRRIPHRRRGPEWYTIASVLLVNELAWHLWNWATGQMDNSNDAANPSVQRVGVCQRHRADDQKLPFV